MKGIRPMSEPTTTQTPLTREQIEHYRTLITITRPWAQRAESDINALCDMALRTEQLEREVARERALSEQRLSSARALSKRGDDAEAALAGLRNALLPFVTEFERHRALYDRRGEGATEWFDTMPGEWHTELSVAMQDCREAVRVLRANAPAPTPPQEGHVAGASPCSSEPVQETRAVACQWIAVEERLPDDDGGKTFYLLAWTEAGREEYARSHQGADKPERVDMANSAFVNARINQGWFTHWMPLPEPPR